MKINYKYFTAFSLILLSILGLFWSSVIINASDLKNTPIYEKNKINYSFSKSKSKLEKQVYNTKELRTEQYCWCSYDEKKNISNNCWFDSEKDSQRAKKIEWEHVVPAENFWKNFKEWRDWNKNCVDSKGKSFKGRSCAEKMNKEYQLMQSDVYNLIPAIWELNAIRSNHSYAEIIGEEKEFWTCDFEVQKVKLNKTTTVSIEPPNNIKGDVARIYRYMDKTYWFKLISDKNKKIFEAWEKIDPVDKKECEIYKLKKKIQNNKMFILEEACKTIK